MKTKTKKKKTAIVPAVVFATIITAGVLPMVASGCDDSQVRLSVAFSVAADFAATFSVADLAFKD